VVVGVLAASIGFLVVGNLAILVASKWARSTTSVIRIEAIDGIDNLEAVDAKLWRGAAPSEEGYRNLRPGPRRSSTCGPRRASRPTTRSWSRWACA
jgi:hypothetical protein